MDISQLISSKICHDLITPIGSIHNCADLLSQSNNHEEEIVELVYNSSNIALQKLVYFRKVFGSSQKTLRTVQELQELAQQYLQIHKIDLQITNSINNDEYILKFPLIALHLVGILTYCAPKGGQMNINFIQLGANSCALKTSISGNLVILKQDSQQALLGELINEQINVSNVQCFLVNQEVKYQNCEIIKIQSTNEITEIEITFTNINKQYDINFS